MVKKYFLFYFLFTLMPYCLLAQQTLLSLDWEERRADASGQFINHDSNNNVIVCGRAYNSFNLWSDIIVTKHNKIGALLWDTIYHDNFGGVMLPQAMAVDSADNIYIAGLTHGNISTGFTEGFLIKITPQGLLAWERNYGWNDSLFGSFRNFKIQDNRYIYVTGKMAPMYWNGPNASVLLKYDLTGNLLWSVIDSMSYPEEGVTVELDKAENVYMTGSTTCCPPYNKAFVAKYDSAGNKRWKTVLIDSFYVEGYARISAIDDSANIFVGFDVSTLGFATNYDAGYAKLDSSGALRWITAYNNFQNNQSSEKLIAIKFDKAYNSYILGFTSLSGSSSRSYLAKFDLNGQMKWSFVPDTSIFPYGFFLVTASIANDSTILGLGHSCLFSLDTSGAMNWRVIDLPSINYYVRKGEILDSTIVLTGNYRPDLAINDSMVVSQINFDVLTGVIKNGVNNTAKIYIYPNPFKEKLTIKHSFQSTKATRVRLINNLGEIVYEINTLEQEVNITGNKLLQGLYILELVNDQNRNMLKLIKQ
jgi:Secretion system C-terminal sorting domain